MNSVNANQDTAPTSMGGSSSQFGKQMSHSTSLMALSKKTPSVPPSLPHDQVHSGSSQPFSRFSPHSQAHHLPNSHSSANLGANKLSFTPGGSTAAITSHGGSGARQSATTGIKLTPSSQVASWANGQRAESPGAPLTKGNTSSGSQSILLTTQHGTFANQQQAKNRQMAAKFGGISASSTQNAQSSSANQAQGHNSKSGGSQSITGIALNAANGASSGPSQGMLHTISHSGKDRHTSTKLSGSTSSSLKQTKSFTQSIESLQVRAGQKPPSNSKVAHGSHQTRTIDQTSSSHKGSHHHHHRLESKGRTQQEAGHHPSRTGGSSSLNHGTTNSQQRQGKDSASHGHHYRLTSGGNGGTISKQSHQRPSHQASSSHQVGTSSSQSRLQSHKSSLHDYKKPTQSSLVGMQPSATITHSTKNQISSGSAVNTGTSSTSQIVSAHAYQPAPSSTQASNTPNITMGNLTFKSGASHSHLHQTPTASSSTIKSLKPPIGISSSDASKHSHTHSLKAPNQGESRGAGGPRSQLHVFTKKPSVDSGSSGTRHLSNHGQQKQSFGSADHLAKENVKSPTHETGHHSSQQRQGSTSLKSQVNILAKNEKKHQSSTHQQAHSSSSTQHLQLKSRNSITKSQSMSGTSGSVIGAKKQSAAPTISHYHPLSTKNNSSSLIGRSSSVSGTLGTAPKEASSSTYNVRHQTSQQTSTPGAQSSQALDRFKDKHPKLHSSGTDPNGPQASSKVNGTIPNVYKQRSVSPPEPTHLSMNGSSTSGLLSRQHTSTLQSKNVSSLLHPHGQQHQSHLSHEYQHKGQTSTTQHIPSNSLHGANQKNSFVSQLSQKMAQRSVPQLKAASGSGNTASQQTLASQSRVPKAQQQSIVQPSSVQHQHKMSVTGDARTSEHATGHLPRKVRSATRASDFEHQGANGGKHGGDQSLGATTGSQKITGQQQKITDRPSSASAGQKFIGKQQNLKELFERNWQSVNVQNKVDPQSGEATQIRSLTVVDTNSMVHEDQQEAAAQLTLAPGTRIIIPNHEPTKCSNKRNGIVRAYAANTNQGLVRNYNEDRVSIILNIVKPDHRKHETWPTCSFFGVYDGHGGSACAEFLRDNLHHFVIKEDSFPWEPEEAIRTGFAKAEARFIEMCQAKDETTGQMTVIERSGSCAIVVLILGEICYVANVGDSRAVLSSSGGQHMTALSRDHKPSDIEEYKRIVKAGGQIYQTTTAQQLQKDQQQQVTQKVGAAPKDPEFIVGPIRVLPGRLSVCRTFGDPEAKLEYRGGNPNVVKAVPDIKTFQISKQHDFIVLASDGIYDKLSDDDIGKAVWMTCEAAKQAKSAQSAGQTAAPQIKQDSAISVHQFCGLGVEGILKNSLMRQSLDNVTVVMIAFANFKRNACGYSVVNSAEKRSESLSNAKNSEQKQPENVNLSRESTQPELRLTEKENQNYSSNGKKPLGPARSQQSIPQASKQHMERADPNGSREKHLTRQSTQDQVNPKQASSKLSEPGSHLNNHSLPRTRSQNYELASKEAAESWRAQNATQMSKHRQSHQQLSQPSSSSYANHQFTKQRPSTDQTKHRLVQNNYVGDPQPNNASAATRQQAKPPMASSNQTGLSSKHSKPAPTQHGNLREDKSAQGMRSRSLKEVSHLSRGAGQGATQSNHLTGKMSHMANLNSNKSLGSANVPQQQQPQQQQFGGTPTTQSSLKSNSITMQHPSQVTSNASQEQMPLQSYLKGRQGSEGHFQAPSASSQGAAQSSASQQYYQHHGGQHHTRLAGNSSSSALIFGQPPKA